MRQGQISQIIESIPRMFEIHVKPHRSRSQMPLVFAGRTFLTALTLLFATHASGQTIDTVDVVRRDAITEINIRFSTQIQYIRHTPLDAGSNLRVYIQVMGFNNDPASPVPYSRQIRGGDGSPNLTVTYPDLQNSILINFDDSTRFTVQPGNDGRTVQILLPSLKGR
jgi:hypothetical protein